MRDLSATRDPYFDLAEVFLQIAIVMSSVSILSRSRPVFYFSLLLATAWATLTEFRRLASRRAATVRCS